MYQNRGVNMQLSYLRANFIFMLDVPPQAD